MFLMNFDHHVKAHPKAEMQNLWVLSTSVWLCAAILGHTHQVTPNSRHTICSSGRIVEPRSPLVLRLHGGKEEVEGVAEGASVSAIDEGDENSPKHKIPPNPMKIYVGNLSPKAHDEDIRTFFSAIGKLVNIEIKKTRKGTRKGYAMVEFESEDKAEKALNTLSGALLSGRAVVLRKDSGYDPVKAEQSRKKWDELLAKKKEEVGSAEDKDEGKKGAQKKVFGRFGRNYWPRGPPGCRVYVGNVKYGSRWDDLRTHMLQAGSVVFGRIIKKQITKDDGTKGSQSRGFAVVQFDSPQTADNAVKSLNQSKFNGRNLVVRLHNGFRAKHSAPAEEGGDEVMAEEGAADEGAAEEEAAEA